MTVVLKNCVWERHGDALIVLHDPRETIELHDPGHQVEETVSRAELERRVRAAHVLMLGVGGLGANALQSLAGLEVGQLTLLDADVVECCNLNRQFVIRVL